MLKIEKPRVEIQELSDDRRYGKFSVSPLERGYATTLGNSLRRVLLSILEGSAITDIKIDGVLHEFATVPGVKEDVAEIILNLKGVVTKLHCESAKKVYIEAVGPGKVTAADIKCDSEVEIVNPQQVIATLDENARLNIEMTVDRGIGYVPCELNKPEKPVIGVIPIDSIFTPVEKVNFTADNIRTGKSLDKCELVLEVWTNGSVDANVAVSSASKILMEHLELLVDISEGVKDSPSIMAEKAEAPKKADPNLTIEELDLSVRSYNCLKRAGINNVEALMTKSEEELMKVRNLGRKSMEEVINKLASVGYKLRKEESIDLF